MERPLKNEYPDYTKIYIQQVEGDDIPVILSDQLISMKEIFEEMSDTQGLFAYKEGKWTIKEVIGHMIDTERIMSYRALRIARKDKMNLAGFDENFYVENGNFNIRTVQDLLEEFTHVRNATISFARTLTPEICTYTGTANENLLSVSALMFIIAGHVQHHLTIVKERYLDIK